MKSSTHWSEDLDRDSFFRYLPVNDTARAWGAYVLNAGYTLIPPHVPYPPRKHPSDHHFTWQRGRILPGHVFVYITRGQGEFESGAAGRLAVAAGDVFVVSPGVWHRYRPDPATGWDEYWMECDGDHFRQLLGLRPIPPDDPVLKVGHDEHILQLFMDITDILRRDPPDASLLLGAYAELLLARLFSAIKRRTFEGRPAGDIIREACRLLSSETGQRQPLAKIAAQLNLSYTSFRRLFKTYTGFAPRQYALQMRLQHATRLLEQTHPSIGQIAEATGFDSIFHFSRYFKQKMGRAPQAYRQEHLSRLPDKNTATD